jgi:hypothetical protein
MERERLADEVRVDGEIGGIILCGPEQGLCVS